MSINTNKSYKTRKEIRKKKKREFFFKKGEVRWEVVWDPCGYVGKKREREREGEREDFNIKTVKKKEKKKDSSKKSTAS
jgi:hypothetical protein